MLKDAVLYYLRTPPVWGSDCELHGHVPLHPGLVAREESPGTLVLEMSSGAMLRTGKIDKRAGAMKTKLQPQMRLSASSPKEVAEWVAAISSNVRALIEVPPRTPPAAPHARRSGRRAPWRAH